MPSNAFTGGIEHGGLTNDFEVKILLCCMVSRLEEPLTEQELQKILLETGLVNYFELADAFSELLTTRHLTCGENGALCLSPLGEQTAAEFEKSLPKTVREKCYQTADRFLRYRRLQNELDIQYRPLAEGWEFSLKMKDYGSDLLSCTLFLPTEQECKQLQKRIYNNPTHIYKGLLAVLLGSKAELQEYLLEEMDNSAHREKQP